MKANTNSPGRTELLLGTKTAASKRGTKFFNRNDDRDADFVVRHGLVGAPKDNDRTYPHGRDSDHFKKLERDRPSEPRQHSQSRHRSVKGTPDLYHNVQMEPARGGPPTPTLRHERAFVCDDPSQRYHALEPQLAHWNVQSAQSPGSPGFPAWNRSGRMETGFPAARSPPNRRVTDSVETLPLPSTPKRETTQRKWANEVLVKAKAYPPPPPPPRVQASPDLVASSGVGKAAQSAVGLGPGPSSEVVQQQLEDLEGKLLLQLNELAQMTQNQQHCASLAEELRAENQELQTRVQRLAERDDLAAVQKQVERVMYLAHETHQKCATTAEETGALNAQCAQQKLYTYSSN